MLARARAVETALWSAAPPTRADASVPRLGQRKRVGEGSGGDEALGGGDTQTCGLTQDAKKPFWCIARSRG